LLFGTGVLAGVGVGVDFCVPVYVLVVVELVDSVSLSDVELVVDFGVGVGVRFRVELEVEVEVSLEVELEVVGVGVRLGVDPSGVNLGASFCIDIIVVGIKAFSTRTRAKMLGTSVLELCTVVAIADEAETTKVAVDVSSFTSDLTLSLPSGVLGACSH
jgi:hypothetical protein